MIPFLILTGLVGLTLIIVDSKIAEPIRKSIELNKPKFWIFEIEEIVNCHQCAGFWVGVVFFPLFAAFLLDLPKTIIEAIFSLATFPSLMLLSGSAISVLSMATRAAIDWMHFNVNLDIDLLNNDTGENEQKTTE